MNTNGTPEKPTEEQRLEQTPEHIHQEETQETAEAGAADAGENQKVEAEQAAQTDGDKTSEDIMLDKAADEAEARQIEDSKDGKDAKDCTPSEPTEAERLEQTPEHIHAVETKETAKAGEPDAAENAQADAERQEHETPDKTSESIALEKAAAAVEAQRIEDEKQKEADAQKAKDAELQDANKAEAARLESERADLEASKERLARVSDLLRSQARDFLANVHHSSAVAPNYLGDDDRKVIGEKSSLLTSALEGDDDEKVLTARAELQKALDAAIYRAKDNEAQRKIAETGGIPSKDPFAYANVPERFVPSDLAEGEETVDMLFPHDVTLTLSSWKQIQFREGMNAVPASLQEHPYLVAHGAHVPVVPERDPSVKIGSEPGAIPARK